MTEWHRTPVFHAATDPQRGAKKTRPELTMARLAGGMLLFVCSLASAAPSCQVLVGHILLVPDLACQILQSQLVEADVPDVVFLTELGVSNTCFAGTFHGTLGTQSIRGTTLSGLTRNIYPSGLFTAVSVIDFVDQENRALGTVVTRDMGLLALDGTVTEELVIIDGTKHWKNVRGTFASKGNEFTGAPVSGTVCFP